LGEGNWSFVRFDGSARPLFNADTGEGWAMYHDELELVGESAIPLELAKLGDDRPAPNGDDFAKSMLAFFTTDDADAMLAWAKANRRNVDMAIDVGCFALNVKRARQSEAA
jgi:hypothetical protein